MSAMETIVEEARRERKTRRIMARIAPSGYVKDLTVGAVAFVAIRITYIYLKALSARPELLAAMGPKLILDILGVCIVGVLGNRGLDLAGELAMKFISSFDKGINRMADSAERTAQSAAEGAIAQRDSAAAQRDLAVSQQQLTSVTEKVAANGDRQLNEVQTLQTYQVSQGRIYLSEMKRMQHTVGRIAEHLGLAKPEKEEEQHVDH